MTTMDTKQVFAALRKPFRYEEIEWRLARANEYNGKITASVLAYINARAVMDRLDEVAGPENWKDRYWRDERAVMCGLSIRVNNEWIEKVDGSDETDIEAVKGALSGALKRAAVRWGISRYLYSLKDGYAEIVDRSNRDAYWGKTKEGKEFWWLPPKLPSWALPSPLEAGLPEGFRVAIDPPNSNEPARVTVLKGQMVRAGDPEALKHIWDIYLLDATGDGEFNNAISWKNKEEETRIRAEMTALKDQCKEKLIRGK